MGNAKTFMISFFIGAAGASASAAPYALHSGPVGNSAESVTVLLDQATEQSWFLAATKDGGLLWLPDQLCRSAGSSSAPANAPVGSRFRDRHVLRTRRPAGEVGQTTRIVDGARQFFATPAERCARQVHATA